MQNYLMWTGLYANVDCLEYISEINSMTHDVHIVTCLQANFIVILHKYILKIT